MPLRSGLGAQIGVAKEETYGTYKAPTRFFQFDSESITLEKEFVRNQGLRAGRMAQAKNLHRATTRTVSGDFNTKLFDQGMGILFNLLHGNTVTPTKITGEEKSEEVYKQTHAIGLTDPFGKSLTLQVGRPGTGGTIHPFSYLGCKIPAVSVSIEAQGEAMLAVTVDGQDEVTSESLASASYDADTLPFTFQEMAVKLGGETAANVRSITLNISIPQSTDRYHLGNSGKKDQPLANAFVELTADAELEFADLDDHNRFKNEEVVKLELLGTGAEIGEDGETFQANFTAPAAKQVSSGPTVQGGDIITQSVSFELLDNGSEAPLTFEYFSTDSAL